MIFFGGINALFTAFAFAGVIFTILLQRKELKYQRYELELTRGELKRSADAQTKTEMSLAKQTEAIDKTLKINVLNDLVKIVDAKLRVGQFTASELADLKNKKEVYLSKLEEMLSDEIGKDSYVI
ncbi:MAG: hypothetical protein H6629_15695 [Calditrichae bacterium]|nr:hypothetical protein [Calditrichia bacterium]